MNRSPDLRILFPTSFSDACFQTGSAIAQMADVCRISLTIVHVVPPGCATDGVRRELNSFLSEADHYDSCQRVLIESDDAPAAVAAFSQAEPFDFIMAPSSDRLGLHSAVMPSFRGRLIRSSQVPLWTRGPSIDHARFRQRIRNVAWLIDVDHDPRLRLRLVTAFAARFDAQLHVLDVVPPVTEATVMDVLDADRPLTPAACVDRFRTHFSPEPEIQAHAEVGSRGNELRRMLERCEADVLFVGHEQAERGIVRARFARDLDRLPCAVVCLADASSSFTEWSFDRAVRTAYARRHEELAPAS